MRKIVNIIWIVLLVILTVAFFTKPSYEESMLKISHELNSRGYQAGLYYTYDKIGHHKSDKLNSTVVIKDRLFYRDIYFPINDKVRKIAIAAFTRLFLVN